MITAKESGRELVDYLEAQAAQRVLVDRRGEGKIPDLLWLLEHPPTITWGAAGGLDHLLVDEAELHARGIQLHPSERGGDITYHEPGQIVGYPIVHLAGEAAGSRSPDLHAYLRAVEGGLMAYLASLGIQACRLPGRTGVWIEGPPARKIAAIGVRAKRWVTSHGFALNVDGALSGFRCIIPCGIRDGGVTSIARELGRAPPWEEIRPGLHSALEASLERPLRLVVGRGGLDLAR
jgi:lipoyl(octanoyl) transferase